METSRYLQYLLSLSIKSVPFLLCLDLPHSSHFLRQSSVFEALGRISGLTGISSPHLPFSVIRRLLTLELHLDCDTCWQLVHLPAFFQSTLHCHTRVIFLIHRCPSWQQLLTKAFSNLFWSTSLAFSNHSQNSLYPFRFFF